MKNSVEYKSPNTRIQQCEYMSQLIADWCSMRNDNYIGFPAVTDTHLGDKILNHITKEVVIKLIEHVSLGTIYIIKSY
jgi:hypothetical protein